MNISLRNSSIFFGVVLFCLSCTRQSIVQEREYRMQRAIEDYQSIYWLSPHSTAELINLLSYQMSDDYCQLDPQGKDFLVWITHRKLFFRLNQTDSSIVWHSSLLGYRVEVPLRDVCDLLYAKRTPSNDILPIVLDSNFHHADIDYSFDDDYLCPYQERLNIIIREQQKRTSNMSVIRHAYQYDRTTSEILNFCTGEQLSDSERLLVEPLIEQILREHSNIQLMRFTLYVPMSSNVR